MPDTKEKPENRGNEQSADSKGSKPDSVLFSLRELRDLEDERVQEAEQEKYRQEEARKRAQEDAARRAEAEARRRALEQEEHQRRQQQARERQAREEQLQLQQAQRQARIRAELELHKHRQEMEITAKAMQKKIPWVPICVTFALLLVGVSSLGYYSMLQKNQRQAALDKARQTERSRQKILKQWAERERQMDLVRQRLNREAKDIADRILLAKNDAKKELLQRQLLQQQRRIKRLSLRKRSPRRVARPSSNKLLNLSALRDDDPIGGLKRGK